MKQILTGIFWVYQGHIVALESTLTEADADSIGWLDCPWNHAEHWLLALQKAGLANLGAGVDYDQVLRGRLLYSMPESRHVVYSDLRALDESQKRQIRERFGLTDKPLTFRHDQHYTLDPEDRYHFFDDDHNA